MTASQRSRLRLAAGVILLALLLCTGTVYPGELHLPFSRYKLPQVSELGGADERTEGEIRAAGMEGRDGEDPGSSESGKKIVGGIMFGSGVLLCSWGLVDWQTDDTQCCPARNTENVAKIVVGVVLINAGLVYLIAGGL